MYIYIVLYVQFVTLYISPTVKVHPCTHKYLVQLNVNKYCTYT